MAYLQQMVSPQPALQMIDSALARSAIDFGFIADLYRSVSRRITLRIGAYS
jgi:hypothetical protein